MALAAACAQGAGRTLYVSPDGADTAMRSGLRPGEAFASLAYACERGLPRDTVRIAAGDYTVTRVAIPTDAMTILGAGAGRPGTDTTQVTRFRASADWTMRGTPNEFHYQNYMIALSRDSMGLSSEVDSLTVRGIRFGASLDNLTDGAILLRLVDYPTLQDLHFEDFAWTGIRLQLLEGFEVSDATFVNVSRVEDDRFAGAIFTRYIAHGSLHDLVFRNTVPGDRQWAVGYKGSGHTDVQLYNCDFRTGDGFDIEVPFENEYGFEIYNCYFNRTISIPKSVQQDDPRSRGFDYSYWIHDCISESSYAIEGPRSHLRVSDNLFDITTDNGRIYTQFGGSIDGPVEFYRNIVVNADRALFWNRDDQLRGVKVYNNTVVMRDSTPRAAAILDVRNDLHGWDVRNNVFINEAGLPRELGANVGCASCTEHIRFSSNVLINSATAFRQNELDSNWVDVDLGFAEAPGGIEAYYTPAPGSFLIDRGEDVGLSYEGNAPDIGAVETDLTSSLRESTDAKDKLRVWPSPAQAIIQVELPDGHAAHVVSFCVRDLAGQVLLEERGGTRAGGDAYVIAVATLTRGVYVVEARAATRALLGRGSFLKW